MISAGYSMLGENEIIPSKSVKIYSGILEFVIGCILVGIIVVEKAPALLALVAMLLFTYSCLHLALILRMRFYNILLASKPLLNGVYNYLAICFLIMPRFPIFLRLGIVCLGLITLSIPFYDAYRMWKSGTRLVA